MCSEENNKRDPIERYGLKTLNCPRQVRELIPFENELISLIRSIKFRKIKNQFQDKLKEDIRQIKNSRKTMTMADKTSNMYRLSKEEHDMLLMNAITRTYKKTNSNVKNVINKEGKEY